jgi:hypothetical protein
MFHKKTNLADRGTAGAYLFSNIDNLLDKGRWLDMLLLLFCSLFCLLCSKVQSFYFTSIILLLI